MCPAALSSMLVQAVPDSPSVPEHESESARAVSTRLRASMKRPLLPEARNISPSAMAARLSAFGSPDIAMMQHGSATSMQATAVSEPSASHRSPSASCLSAIYGASLSCACALHGCHPSSSRRCPRWMPIWPTAMMMAEIAARGDLCHMPRRTKAATGRLAIGTGTGPRS